MDLSSGKKLPCDLYIPCHAKGGNSSFMPTGCVDERGYIKVDDTFKVQVRKRLSIVLCVRLHCVLVVKQSVRIW